MADTTYSRLAEFYDRMMNAQKYSSWINFTNNTIQQYKIKKGLCLDLACGTGTMSKLMKASGFDVIGVDISENMLAVAKKKNPDIEYLKSDIQDFKLNEKVKNQITLAICFYDSLNYFLSTEKLLKAFENISRNLPKNAYFIFDINTKEHVLEAQKFSPAIYQDDDLFCVFNYGGNGAQWNLEIDGFVKKDQELFEHFHESHQEIGFSFSEILDIAQKSNFQYILSETEKKVGKNNQEYQSRIIFVLKKI